MNSTTLINFFTHKSVWPPFFLDDNQFSAQIVKDELDMYHKELKENLKKREELKEDLKYRRIDKISYDREILRLK